EVKRRGIKEYYKLTPHVWMHCPTSRRLVLAEEQRALVDRLENPGGSLRGDLRTAFESAEGPVRGAAVGPSAQLDFRFDFSPWVRIPLQGHAHPLVLSVASSSRLTRDTLEVRTVRTYSSSEKAKLAAVQIDDSVGQAFGALERSRPPLRSGRVSTQGHPRLVGRRGPRREDRGALDNPDPRIARPARPAQAQQLTVRPIGHPPVRSVATFDSWGNGFPIIDGHDAFPALPSRP